MTPEGKVKAAVTDLLKSYGTALYIFMSVPNGYGKSTLDYLCIFHGRGFAIETKRLKKKPTPRQEGTIEDIEMAGGVTFVIDCPEAITPLREWLERVDTLALAAVREWEPEGVTPA